MRYYPVLILFFAAALFYQCNDTVKRPASAIQSSDGESLSKIYCASCHMYSEPELLDKSTWGNFVLIRMGAFMGIYRDGTQYVDKLPSQWMEPGVGGQRVANANVYPEEPLLDLEEWEKIVDFYMRNAPDKMSAPKRSEINVGVPGFESRVFADKKDILPVVQAIAVDASTKEVYAAQYQGGGITKFNQNGRKLDQAKNESLVVHMLADDKQFVSLDMATRYASDNPVGALDISESFGAYKNKKKIANIPNLMRPVHLAQGDLTGNGKDDFVISEYGNMLGALSWIETKSDGTYQRHELFSDDGSTKTEITDIDRDGKNDIIALKANSDEGIDWYMNKGDGKFERKRKLRFPPTNGSTHFQLVDFDNDGLEDILYSNGDNGDYTPLLKPYHGIHLYLRKGDEYKESFFLPLNGVYQSEAVDFDQDGDMDIAAVSFHPDFTGNPKESFVIYINDGSNNFTPYTIPQHANSRWMRFITSDIDSDGDIDILLSAMNIKTPEIPQATAAKWQAANEAIVLVENKLK